MEIKTLKEFLELRKNGVDVCDSTIECPYCYMEYYEEKDIKDEYDKFIYYIESNVELEQFNPKSCVGEIAAVKYLDLLKKDIKVWIKFTDEVNREEYQFSNYDDEDDFIENCLCYTLENMLNGNYSENDYKLFNEMIEEGKSYDIK